MAHQAKCRDEWALLDRKQYRDDMEIVAILKDWIIPVGSVVLSIWYAASAKKDAETAQSVLTQINSAIAGWQNQLNDSAVQMLNSRIEVVGARSHAQDTEMKSKLLESLSERVKHIVEHPASGADAETQLRTLNLLTQTIQALTRGSVTPEVVLAAMQRSGLGQP